MMDGGRKGVVQRLLSCTMASTMAPRFPSHTVAIIIPMHDITKINTFVCVDAFSKWYPHPPASLVATVPYCIEHNTSS
jgi:hypothetical protein